MNDNVPLMDEDAQRLYINSMISNPDIFARVNTLLKPTFFEPHLAKGVKFLQEYFAEHRNVPNASIYTAATKLVAEHIPLNQTDNQAVLDMIAGFCRFRAVIDAVQKSVGSGGHLEKGDLGTMMATLKQAVEMGLQTDIGINYFENVLQRLEGYDDEDPVYPTGWDSVDEVIGGGVGKQELVLFLAPSGGGKSVGMLNLAKNFMERGMSGAYISLEMKDKKVSLRTDQMLSRMTSGMVNLNKSQAAAEIMKFHERTGVSFFIKRMRETTTTANDVTSYLRELRVKHAFRPDWVVVDYLDIMAPVQNGAGDSMFLKDKFVSEEVRAIGFDEDAIMISGSQLGKHATEAINEGKVIHQGDVQGGSSKTNTADLMITMEKTELMHEAGEYRFGFAKARNSDATGKRIPMAWDKKSLLISDMKKRTDALELKKKRTGTMNMESVVPTADKRRSITDLIEKTNSGI